MRQHADRVGAGAEERGMAQRDDARIAQRKIERDREQHRDEQFGAEAEMAREREVERQRQQPRQRLPPAQLVPLGQRAGAEVVVVRGGRAHDGFPNRPCGRHSSSMMVST